MTGVGCAGTLIQPKVKRKHLYQELVVTSILTSAVLPGEPGSPHSAAARRLSATREMQRHSGKEIQ